MGQDWIVVATVLVVAVLGVMLFHLAVLVFKHALATALSLFYWAVEGGFIAVALYIILWAVATPFMIIVCIVGGVIRLWAEFATRDRPISRQTPVEADDRRSPKSRRWQARW